MKKYVLVLLLVFSFIPLSKVMDALTRRPWPVMVYSDKNGAKYQLVSLRDVKKKPFVTFLSTLLSTPGVFELYQGGTPWDKAKAQSLWNRVYPRTEKWFQGVNTVIPWTVIQLVESKEFIGILGANLHQENPTAAEYRGIEICYALDPKHHGKSILSNAFRCFAQAFSPQLNSLGDAFDHVFAPIAPINFPSLRLVIGLGFEVGTVGSPNQPYVSNYYPNSVSNGDKPRLLGYADRVVKKLKETPDLIDPTCNSFEDSIDEADWKKLAGIRVVAFMPKEIFFSRFVPVLN